MQMHDLDAEIGLLSACLQHKTARIEARKRVTGADFYLPWCEDVYNAMTYLDKAGHPVDAITVGTRLQESGVNRFTMENYPSLLSYQLGLASSASYYADTVHEWSIRRRIHAAAVGLAEKALQPEEPAGKLATQAVTTLSSIRDGHGADTNAKNLGAILAMADVAPSWVIPGLLEVGDRLMLTGTEGVGKSAMSRQLLIMAAAGLHPFTGAVIPPQRVLFIDAENKENQIRRQAAPLVRWLQQRGSDPIPNTTVDALYPRRINLTSDRDLSMIHQTIDAYKPSLVFIGPIYKMSPRALQTDDDAHPFLAALDTITERGCALVVEAHAGHSQESTGGRGATARQLRPRGSSALLGWPEFGMGLRNLGNGYADLERWRGDREERSWPSRLRRAPGNRWEEVHPDYDPRSAPVLSPPPVEEPPAQGTVFDGNWDGSWTAPPR